MSNEEDKQQSQDHLPPFGLFGSLIQLLQGGPNVQVITITIGEDDISFENQEMEATSEDDHLPPLKFINQNYNVMLKVSHTQYAREYKPFQENLEHMVPSALDILGDVHKQKPAAIRVDIDPTALFQSHTINPMFMMAALSGEPLMKAANFISENNNNVIMPTCQLRKALRNRHLFDATTEELLSVDEFRTFEETYGEDVEKQQPVQTGMLYIRSVPQRQP